MRFKRLLCLCFSVVLYARCFSADYRMVASAGQGMIVVSKQDFSNEDVIWEILKDGEQLNLPPQSGTSNFYKFDEDGVSVFSQDSGNKQLFGLINTDGKILIPALYSYVARIGKGLYAIGSPVDFIVYRLSDGANSNKIKGTPFGKISDNMLAVRRNGKFGFLNTDWKLVVPAIYSEVCDFSDGLAAVRTARGKWGFVNKCGRQVIPAVYDHDDVWDDDDGHAELGFENGVAVMYKKGNYGAIDKTGKTIIPFNYSSVWVDTVHNEICVIKWNNEGNAKRRVFDKKGHFLRETSDVDESEAEGVFSTKVDGWYRCGVKGADGTIIIQPVYDMIICKDNMYFAKDDDGVDVFDLSGKVLYGDIADNCLYFLLP